MRCPYCARPLRMGGMRCRACRRYVLRWPHVLALAVAAFAVIYALLELTI